MKGISFVAGKNLHEPKSLFGARTKIRCPSTAGNRIFVTKAKTFPSTTKCSSLALRFLRDQPRSVKFKGTSGGLELCVMLYLIAENMFTPNLDTCTCNHRHVHSRGFGFFSVAEILNWIDSGPTLQPPAAFVPTNETTATITTPAFIPATIQYIPNRTALETPPDPVIPDTPAAGMPVQKQRVTVRQGKTVQSEKENRSEQSQKTKGVRLERKKRQKCANWPEYIWS